MSYDLVVLDYLHGSDDLDIKDLETRELVGRGGSVSARIHNFLGELQSHFEYLFPHEDGPWAASPDIGADFVFLPLRSSVSAESIELIKSASANNELTCFDPQEEEEPVRESEGERDTELVPLGALEPYLFESAPEPYVLPDCPEEELLIFEPLEIMMMLPQLGETVSIEDLMVKFDLNDFVSSSKDDKIKNGIHDLVLELNQTFRPYLQSHSRWSWFFVAGVDYLSLSIRKFRGDSLDTEFLDEIISIGKRYEVTVISKSGDVLYQCAPESPEFQKLVSTSSLLQHIDGPVMHGMDFRYPSEIDPAYERIALMEVCRLGLEGDFEKEKKLFESLARQGSLSAKHHLARWEIYSKRRKKWPRV
ncbi:MAG: hypothetical protein AB7W16_25635 [Candidatus Obscuribacterales bacterium]